LTFLLGESTFQAELLTYSFMKQTVGRGARTHMFFLKRRKGL